jgi:hypothetical protein
MEGEYANQSKATLETTLGRGVCGGELYAAHFLGPDAACKLIKMNGATPNASAAAAFPTAADANRSVFYHADGSAKSVHEVYNWALRQPSGTLALTKTMPKAPVKPAATNVSPSGDWLAGQLYDATEPSGDTLALLSPVSLSPGVIHILSSLNGPDAEPRKN